MNASTAGGELLQLTRVTHYCSSVWIVLSAVLLVPLFIRVGLVALKYRGLRTRKDYALIVIMCAAYVVQLSLNCVNGVLRLYLLLHRLASESVASHTCFWQPQIPLLNVVIPVIGWMYVAFSVDRLLLILRPLWHHRQDYTYALKLAAPGLLYGVVNAVWQQAITVQWSQSNEPPRASRLCLGSQVSPRTPRLLLMTFVSICPIISVVVFLFSVYFYYMRFIRAKKQAGKDDQARQALKTQQRMTKAFMTSTSLNFVFLVIPGLITMAIARPAKCEVKTALCIVLPYTAINMSSLNYLADAVLFNRLKEVRIGWRAWINGKSLPFDPTTWQTTY